MDARSNGPKENAEQLAKQQQIALQSFEEPAIDTQEALISRAKKLLVDFARFKEERDQATGFAHGGLGLLAQHTSYYNGFAVVLSLARATAVAISYSDRQQHNIVFDKELQTWAGASEKKSDVASLKSLTHWQRLVEELLDQYLPDDKYVDLAIVSSIPPGCMEAFLASVAVSVVQAICNVQGIPVPENSVSQIRDAIEESIDAEFSKAFVLVAQEAKPGVLAIIDTDTEELIPLEAPSRSQLSWGLVEVESGAPRRFDFYQACGTMGKEALSLLQTKQFPELTTFRDVQHADLQRLLNALPHKYRPIVRHLVNENKRVQSMIGAIRGKDWQKLGGLLFISHSSLSNEWQGTNKAIDFVVSEAAQMSSDGIYGACLTGRGGYIVIVGLTLALPRFLESVKQKLSDRFGRKPKSLIL